jgi:hypothetical protein
MRAAGVVGEDGKPTFSPYALRHQFVTNASKWTHDIHRVAKWSGHKSPLMVLNTYGHYRHDPREQEDFVQMPNFLRPKTDIEAAPMRLAPPVQNVALPMLDPPLECPIPVPEYAERFVRQFLVELWRQGQAREALRSVNKTVQQMERELRRLGLPTIGELEAMALREGVIVIEGSAGPAAKQDCPIDLPDNAPAWLAPFIRLLDRGGKEKVSFRAACRAICKDEETVKETLRMLKLPGNLELRRRLRSKRIMKLHDLGHQDADIATQVGTSRQRVWEVRDELKKANAYKSLKNKNNLPRPAKPDTRTEHKNQLKLL